MSQALKVHATRTATYGPRPRLVVTTKGPKSFVLSPFSKQHVAVTFLSGCLEGVNELTGTNHYIACAWLQAIHASNVS